MGLTAETSKASRPSAQELTLRLFRCNRPRCGELNYEYFHRDYPQTLRCAHCRLLVTSAEPFPRLLRVSERVKQLWENEITMEYANEAEGEPLVCSMCGDRSWSWVLDSRLGGFRWCSAACWSKHWLLLPSQKAWENFRERSRCAISSSRELGGQQTLALFE